MKWFRSMYVWAMNAKLFMALYFIVMVFALALVSVLSGVYSVPLLTLAEMLLTCAVIGFLQRLLLNDSVDYSHGVFFGRSVLWLAVSTVLVLGAALVMNWFAGFTYWALVAFGAFWLLALTFTLLGLKFEQDADTVRLNDDLKRFKERSDT